MCDEMLKNLHVVYGVISASVTSESLLSTTILMGISHSVPFPLAVIRFEQLSSMSYVSPFKVLRQ